MKAKTCGNCGLPFITAEEVEAIYRYRSHPVGLCFYGPGSAYSAGECRNPPKKKATR